GGSAAHAARTGQQVGAEVIYVASGDGTPRQFGAGSLPGLRYPWLKWFDPQRSLPLTDPAAKAVYALHELDGEALLVSCLGQADAHAEVVIEGNEARRRCTHGMPALGATFEGLARIDALSVPDAIEAGATADARVLWQPLVAHPEPQQMW